MSQKVEYRNGYKYMYCEQCDLDFNVPIQKTGFFICPWCEMKNRKKEKECEANGKTCHSERPCEFGNAVHNG